MPFDLSKYELEDTAVLTLKNARGDDDLLGEDEKPVTVEVYSPGSPQGVKAIHKASRLAQLRTFRGLRNESSKQDAEDADREYAEKLAAFTKSISPNFPVAPLTLYSNARLVWIAKQVDEFIGKYANFSKGSSAS
jgi:hypothetical protein